MTKEWCDICKELVEPEGNDTRPGGYCPGCGEETTAEVPVRYSFPGYLYEPGEEPSCQVCGKLAHWDTPWLGTHVCDNEDCITNLIRGNCEEIKLQRYDPATDDWDDEHV